MRGLIAIAAFFFFWTSTASAQMSKEQLMDARARAVQQYYTFSPKRVTSLAVVEPPILDGLLAEACWRAAATFDDFLLTDSATAATQRTSIALRHRGGVLYVGFHLQESTPGSRRTPDAVDQPEAPWDRAIDNLQLYFSPGNDHTNYYRFVIDIEGGTRLFRGYGVRGEFPHDATIEEQELKHGPSLACEVADAEDGWTGEVAIPASALGLQGDLEGQVWGFTVLRVRTPKPAEVSAWSFDPERPYLVPIDFGDLLFGERGVTVSRIDLARPYWGDNRATITIENTSSDSTNLRIITQVYMPVDEETYYTSEQRITVGPAQTVDLQVPYKISWRGRWPVYPQYCQRLSFRVEEAESGLPLYETSYPIAFDVGVKPSERYGARPDAPNPSPDDPEFIQKKRAFIIGRIPEFRRVGTAEGAESDFVLEAVDGSVRFNLMAEGTVQQIADWLYDRFDTDLDRMLGATFFVHQRTVTCHAGFLTRLGPLSPLSILRGGGGLCDNRAKTLAGILSRMKRETSDRPYQGRCLGLKGHVVCAVASVPEPESEADYWVLDPDVGVFYFTWDNTRFATLGELRRDRGLSYRMNFNNVRHSHEFYFNTDHQFTYEWEQTPVWPAEAPPW